MLQAILAFLVPTAHAQISTSTIGTLIDDTISDGGTVLSDNLLKIFGFALALAILFFIFRWVRGLVRKPR